MTDTASSTIAIWEQAEIERANASGLTPVVFVHGLWLLSSSWQRWRGLFEVNGPLPGGHHAAGEEAGGDRSFLRRLDSAKQSPASARRRRR